MKAVPMDKLTKILAAVFFYMLFTEIRQSRSRKFSHSLHATLISSSPLMTRNEEEEEFESSTAPDDVTDFKKLRKVRVYSLYGALARRTSHFPKFQQWCIITFLPFIVFIGHALAWTGFLLFGIQILGGVSIQLIYPRNKDADILWTEAFLHLNSNSSADLPLSNVELNDIFNRLIFQELTEIVKFNSNKINDWLDSISIENGEEYLSRERSLQLFVDVVNVFNFSPVISLGYFWDNGAGFIAVLTFLAMFVLPVGKSLIWIWYYFAPADEIWRGWIVTITDFSGKWMIAYVFIMTILAVALTFTREITLPWYLFAGLLPKDSYLLFSSLSAMSWNGRGGVLLIVCCIISVIIGQAVLLIHQLSVDWEEQRRQLKDSPSTATTQSVQDTTPTFLGSGISNESPFAAMDTPFLISSRNITNSSTPLVVDTVPPGENSLIRAIESFSNLQDINSPELRQVRRPMFQQLAKYGSRVVLLSDDLEQGSLHRIKFIHPKVEAMCDRVHQPMQGYRLRWTPFGKAVIWFFLFLLAMMFILSQLVALFQTKMTGVNQLVVEPQDKVKSFSVYSVASEVIHSGWNNASPYHVRWFIFFTVSFMPLVRLLAVAYLWVLPMTLEQQKMCFSFLEFSEAWSSLEVFIVTIIGIRLQAGPMMNNLSDGMTPKIASLVKTLLPFTTSLLGTELTLLPGFWFVFAAIVLEKLVGRLIIQQAVTAISERQAEVLLSTLASQEQQRGRVGLPPIPENASQQLIGDATEGLLETDAAFFFSPAQRYTLAPHTMYAGLPRSLWCGAMVRWGLLADADLVAEFGSLSAAPIPRPDSTEPTVLQENDLVTDVNVNDGFRLDRPRLQQHLQQTDNDGPLVF